MKQLLGVELADVVRVTGCIGLEWSRFVASVSYFSGPLQQLHMLGNLVRGEKWRGSHSEEGVTLLCVFSRSIDCFFVHPSSTSTRNISLYTRYPFLFLRGSRYYSFLCAKSNRCFDSRLDCRTTSLVELNWQSKRIELNA